MAIPFPCCLHYKILQDFINVSHSRIRTAHLKHSTLHLNIYTTV